jgi:hypothetical protein
MLCLSYADASAQAIGRQRARRTEKPPKALIIVLPHGTTRLQAMMDMGKAEQANQLRQDLLQVRQKMVEDFNDNFDYCPYYFVVDSNVEKVKDRQFEGILLDSNLQAVSNPVIGPDDTTQMIGYYGYRLRDKDQQVHTIYGDYTAMFNGDTDAMLQHLVLSDYKFEQLNRPLPRTPVGFVPRSKLKKPRYAYRFESKVFDVRYRMSAALVASGLWRFYGPYPY